jgi:hypothetical protein
VSIDRRPRWGFARRGRRLFLLTLSVAAVTAGTVAAEPAAGPQEPDLPVAQPGDTFSHARHQSLHCLTCHLSRTGAMLTFEPPRGCQICHHQAPARSDCVKCHEPDGIPGAVGVAVVIAPADKPARERPVDFRHERHAELDCTACHGVPVTLAPVDSAGSCRGCHDRHHQAGRDCAACHRTGAITQAHARPVRAHVACNSCHPTAAISPLSPTRSFCLACHQPDVDHHPERECADCHFQAGQEDYRARLLRREGPG